MKRVQLLREARGKSKLQLSYEAKVPAPVIGWVESGRFVPYEPQLRRLADALGFDGEPEKLLDDLQREVLSA